MHKISAYLPEGKVIMDSGETMVYFGGTNYLGTVQDASLCECFQEGVERYGLHLSTSRASDSALAVYEKADRHVAQWLGAEAGLVFSSGFTACQTLLKTLEEEGYTLFYAPETHPANCRTNKDRFAQALEDWIGEIKGRIMRSSSPAVVYYKPIDPIYLRVHPLEWLMDLPRGTTLVLDDSHSLGVNGEKGAGVYDWLRKKEIAEKMQADVIGVGSLGKGLGLPAGYMMGRGIG